MGGDVGGLIEVGPPSAFEGLVAYRGVGVTHRYPPHWHDELHLCLYTAGSGYVGDRRGRRRVAAGDFLLTPPGEVHHNWVTEREGVTFRSLYVPVPILRDVARQVTGRDDETAAFSPHRTRDPGLSRAFLMLHRGLEQPTMPLRRDGLLVEFLDRLVRARGSGAGSEPSAIAATGAGVVTGRSAGAGSATVRRVREYLHDHLGEPVALADLSRVADLSPFHLHRVFRRATGLPPHGYLLMVRVNQARDLLRRGVPPAEVALHTGFFDQSHLTRHFHRLVGVTPARFRAAERGRETAGNA